MSDRSAVSSVNLSTKQLLFVARKLGSFSKRPLLHVGTDLEAIAKVRNKGGEISGIVDQKTTELPDYVSSGSPCGSMQTPAHSIHRVLIGDTNVFAGDGVTPESTIALANLLSTLKGRGKLVIPVTSLDGTERELWHQRLAGFPGKLTGRVLKTGMLGYLTLTFVVRGIHSIPVLEFTIDRKTISRLEWHKLAREAVMKRMQHQTPAAA